MAAPVTGAHSDRWLTSAELIDHAIPQLEGQPRNLVYRETASGAYEYQLHELSPIKKAQHAITGGDLYALHLVMQTHNLSPNLLIYNPVQWDGTSSLFRYAVQLGRIQIVAYLLGRGALVNNEDANVPILYEATCRGNAEMTALLLRYGANPNTKSYRRKLTPLFVAAAWNLRCENTSRQYIADFVFAHLPEEAAEIASPCPPQERLQQRMRTLQLLLAYGADPIAAIAVLAADVSIDRYENENIAAHDESDEQLASAVFAGLDRDRIAPAIEESLVQEGLLATFASPGRAILMQDQWVFNIARNTLLTTANVHSYVMLGERLAQIALKENFEIPAGLEILTKLPTKLQQAIIQQIAYSSIQQITRRGEYQLSTSWITKAATVGHPPLPMIEHLSPEAQAELSYVPGSGKFPYPQEAALRAAKSELGVLLPPLRKPRLHRCAVL